MGIVAAMESPVLTRANRKELLTLEEARKHLLEEYWEKTRDMLSGQAWKMYQQLQSQAKIQDR